MVFPGKKKKEEEMDGKEGSLLSSQPMIQGSFLWWRMKGFQTCFPSSPSFINHAENDEGGKNPSESTLKKNCLIKRRKKEKFLSFQVCIFDNIAVVYWERLKLFSKLHPFSFFWEVSPVPTKVSRREEDDEWISALSRDRARQPASQPGGRTEVGELISDIHAY